MRCAITGTNGFVGRALLAALKNRDVDIQRWDRNSGQFDLHSSDPAVADRWAQRLAGVDVVVHLAALVHRPAADAQAYLRVNRDGTARLAAAAAAAQVKRFVFLSTAKVFGEGGSAPYDECAPAAPQDAYAASKWAAEQALLEVAAGSALEPVIIRPPLVYGPSVGGNFGSLWRLARLGLPLPFAAVDNRRDMIGIDNLVDLIALGMERPGRGRQIAALLRWCAVCIGRNHCGDAPCARPAAAPVCTATHLAGASGQAGSGRRRYRQTVRQFRNRYQCDTARAGLDAQGCHGRYLAPHGRSAMMVMLPWLIVMVLVSALLTASYRQAALRRQWLDAPNHRSSHVQTTPRGAGIVFAALIAIAASVGLYIDQLSAAVALSIAAGFGIAVLGWCDDIRGVSARRRFAGYWLISLVALAAIGVDRHVEMIGVWMLLALLICSAGMQWVIHLYNFMDGINGIAALEAIYVLAAVLLLSSGSVYHTDFAWITGIALAVLCGFLVWNFPRGKVFMGDASSAFLGFLLALLAVWSALAGGPGPIVWLILLGVFVVDASYTLIVRMLTGQAWHQAHRQHTYQILTQRWGSHTATVAAVMGVNLVWLLPWAWLAQQRWIDDRWALLFAYGPLTAICYGLGAGKACNSRV
jgi:Fuc2NAc and GlcNAc transferase